MDLLKEVKRSNDRINSSIGVESAHLVVSCLTAQSIPIGVALAKVEQYIAETEKIYAGPDVLRRNATLKQQFRIQRDRRNLIISTAMDM